MTVVVCAGAVSACLAIDDPHGSPHPAQGLGAALEPAPAEPSATSPCDATGAVQPATRGFRLRPQISVERAPDGSGRVRLGLANADAFEYGAPRTWSLGDGSVSRTEYGPVIHHDFGPALGPTETSRSFVVEVALESRGNVYIGRTCVDVQAASPAAASGEAGS